MNLNAKDATNILKGVYWDFELIHDADEITRVLTNGSLTVNNEAEIRQNVIFSAQSDEPVEVKFAGTTFGGGIVHFEKDVTAVYGADADVFGGTYYNLTIASLLACMKKESVQNDWYLPPYMPAVNLIMKHIKPVVVFMV